MFSPFRNRREAGRILAMKLLEYSGPNTIVLGLPRGGVPVAPPCVCRVMSLIADNTVCMETPSYFQAVGQWYIDFTQTSEDEVHRFLESAWNPDFQQKEP